MSKAQYFFDSILPAICASLACGIFPIFISNSHETKTVYTNKYLYCVNVGFLLFFGSMVLNTVKEARSNIMSNNYYEKNRVSNIGIGFVFAGGMIYVTIIYIRGFTRTESVKNTLIKFYNIDRILEKIGANINYSYSIAYQIGTQFPTLVLIAIITYMQKENIHREKFRELSTSTWIVFIFPAVCVNIFENQFAYVVLLIYQRFKLINNELKALRTSKFLYKEFKKPNYTISSKRMTILMKLHDELCDISETVNKNYSIQVVTNLMFQYGILLFSLFYSYWMVCLIVFCSF